MVIKMKRMYIALALAGLIGCAVLVDAGINGIGTEDGNGVAGGAGKWLRNRMMNQWKRGHVGAGGFPMAQQWRWQQVAGNYLNTTRMEGVLEYDGENYTVDGVVLYLGNEWFLESLAKSDYDGDGTYEYVWQELEGLTDFWVVVNGVLHGDVLCASHINGIWLRAPREADITEITGVLEQVNGSYVIDGTELLFKKRRYSRSDMDGDGSLERTVEEINGLVGQEITVDGTMTEKGLFAVHINGIWVM